MLGLGLGLSLTGSSAAAFSPLSLFASAEKGVWYDPSDISTLWKDTAGTDPVTADGDAVARIDDKSGNAFHATQAVAGNRWIYRTGSGNPYIDNSDGDRFFDVPQIKASVSNWSMCVAVDHDPASVAYNYLFDSPTGRLIFVTLENGTNFSYYDGTDFRGAAYTSGNAETRTWICANGTGKVRANGSDIATGLSYTQRAISGATKFGCNTNGAGDFFRGICYGLVLVDRALTAAEITDVEAHLDAKMP